MTSASDRIQQAIDSLEAKTETGDKAAHGFIRSLLNDETITLTANDQNDFIDLMCRYSRASTWKDAFCFIHDLTERPEHHFLITCALQAFYVCVTSADAPTLAKKFLFIEPDRMVIPNYESFCTLLNSLGKDAHAIEIHQETLRTVLDELATFAPALTGQYLHAEGPSFTFIPSEYTKDHVKRLQEKENAFMHMMQTLRPETIVQAYAHSLEKGISRTDLLQGAKAHRWAETILEVHPDAAEALIEQIHDKLGIACYGAAYVDKARTKHMQENIGNAVGRMAVYATQDICFPSTSCGEANISGGELSKYFTDLEKRAAAKKRQSQPIPDALTLQRKMVGLFAKAARISPPARKQLEDAMATHGPQHPAFAGIHLAA